MKLNLQDLIKATAKDEEQAPIVRERSHKELAIIRRKAQIRLVAQEFIRNGMDLPAAYSTITGAKSVKGRGMHRLLGKSVDDFIDEVSRCIEKTDVTRERALSILWTMVNTSILDFFDENGDMLTVKQMKKLPRVMQILLSKIEVHTSETEVRDDKGNILMDDVGRPYLKKKTHVKIELPEKLASMRQLAEIMRWVGPTVSIHNTVNIGRAMADADQRVRQMGRIYDESGHPVD